MSSLIHGRRFLVEEGGKSHLETPDPADSAPGPNSLLTPAYNCVTCCGAVLSGSVSGEAAAMSQQSWRSRKTDATEEEEGEGSEIDAKKAARKFKKQPDMALRMPEHAPRR